MPELVKFVFISRVIDPMTHVHYLDAIDENGLHWRAEMSTGIEPWICYTKLWKLDPQHPKC
jgi:hypothetical protein